MVWQYEVTSKKLYHNNALVFSGGYAGRGEHKNRPTSEHIENWGPIPRGKWRIGGYTNNKGPLTITLTPGPGTHTYGRTAFRIHGESVSDPGNASQGCIIVGYNARLAMVNSGDRDLEVVW
ncbi:tlde1 domain-containing protein [Caldimonas brevitalea]|uniref:tlde1 domain-containing protein n=1 Tax=Caldimonas brevitalea TaxID=413882 RepID=UPI0009F9B3A6|nr:tlde1 domain-containing protein [Caldimonas brevitalea]